MSMPGNTQQNIQNLDYVFNKYLLLILDIYRVAGLSCPEAGSVYQLFLGFFLMFLACLDHARWAKFHLGILGPQE